MINYDRRILLLNLAAGWPAIIAAWVLLWMTPYLWFVRVAVGGAVAYCWIWIGIKSRNHQVRRLQTISNLLAALREGDFSIRAREAGNKDALGAVMFEINTLSDTLRTQRLGAEEATALLRAVMK